MSFMNFHGYDVWSLIHTLKNYGLIKKIHNIILFIDIFSNLIDYNITPGSGRIDCLYTKIDKIFIELETKVFMIKKGSIDKLFKLLSLYVIFYDSYFQNFEKIPNFTIDVNKLSSMDCSPIINLIDFLFKTYIIENDIKSDLSSFKTNLLKDKLSDDAIINRILSINLLIRYSFSSPHASYKFNKNWEIHLNDEILKKTWYMLYIKKDIDLWPKIIKYSGSNKVFDIINNNNYTFSFFPNYKKDGYNIFITKPQTIRLILYQEDDNIIIEFI